MLCWRKQPLLPLPDSNTYLLPADGAALYYGQVLSAEEAQRYFENLLAGVPWRHDQIVIFGKRLLTERQVAWYGDPGCSYSYSGSNKEALAWTPELLALKARVQDLTRVRFNSCLLNLYQDGTQGMSWHSDDEKELGENPAIASLSLGAERRFSFKHKRTQQLISLVLQNGSLLLMKDATQHHWLHSLPKTKKVQAPRINLTFRTIKRD